ncbi:MAG: hypothetical protein JWO03_2842 [Bacteroidetes bacterium]|nr:hypothetical protein [Bacteroidota bacterium]
MKLRPVHVVLFFVVFFLSAGLRTMAQVPTNCFEIGTILVDACGSPEGENEMFRFQVGPNPINSANLSITWPNNSFLGFCTDSVKLAALNATINGCGILLAPPGGILPAGKEVLVITSTNMNVSFNSFANLNDTLYVLFQCAGNTSGHFANYSTSGGSQARTLILTETTSGCADTVTYMKNLLINQSGNHSATNGDGAGASFDYAGNITYYNNGCNAPFIAPSIHVGNDTTYTFCASPIIINLAGTKTGSFRSTRWEGGNGTFSQPDSLTTTYTLSPADISPIQFVLVGRLCPDSLMDTISIIINPPVHVIQALTICQGNSYTIGTHTYTSTGAYHDTLLTVTGCDSVVTTDLTVIPFTAQTVPLSGCNSVTYNGTAYNSSTTILDTLRGSTGCDSIHYTVNITVKYATALTQNLIVCPGQSITIGTNVHSSAGTFIDVLTNAAGCDSTVTTTLSFANNTVDAGNNVTICKGDSTQLQATGGLIYTWTPATGLSNPNIANPEAKPNTTTTYVVTSSVASSSQIVNGDFSGGNTGFSSSYTYTSPTNLVEGEYTVTNNPQSWNGGLSACGDHTTGSGNMLVVNGAVTANVSVYCQTVSVVPNTDYAFSTWLQSVSSPNPAQLQFSINSSLLGSVFSASVTVCNWQQFYATWNSGTSTTANICIVNQNTIASGNDFALDDISFSPICIGVDSVTVTVTQPVTSTQNPTICQGQTFNAGTHSYTTSGTYTDTVIGGAASGCDSIVTTNLNVISPVAGALSVSGSCSVVYNGQTYTSGTVVADTIRSQIGGCDSIYRAVTITVTPVATSTVNKNACINPGQSYFAGGQNQTTAGIYNDTIRTTGGCDSIYTITNLSLITPTNTSRRIDSCNRVTVGGVVFTTDTVISDVVTSVLGCDSIVRTDSIHIHSPFTISITSSQVLPLVEGDSTLLSIVPSGTYHNVVWSPDSNISSTSSTSPMVAPHRTTTYAVVAADSNNCSVSGSIEVPVTANSQLDFIMPTAFSPNGDGKNDMFKAILRSGAEVTMFHVYNRWGELIYDKDRDNSDGWDGFFKNIAQPIGVYVYFISVKGVAGNVIRHEGNLTLLR